MLSLGFEPGELRSGESGGSSEVWGDVCAEMPDDQPHFQVTWAGDGAPRRQYLEVLGVGQ